MVRPEHIGCLVQYVFALLVGGLSFLLFTPVIIWLLEKRLCPPWVAVTGAVLLALVIVCAAFALLVWVVARTRKVTSSGFWRFLRTGK